MIPSLEGWSKDVPERAGVIVIGEARDGREAVVLILQVLPDVVVMDVVMPGFEGIWATREIRRQLPDQLVIALTGAGSDDDELALRAIAHELVLSPETIRSHIKNILRKLKVRSRQEAVVKADQMRNAEQPHASGRRSRRISSGRDS